MKISDIMTTSVACIRADESLSTAARLMWECDCGAIPVVGEDGQKAVGMITDRDICMAVWTKDQPPSRIPVLDAMSRELYRCAPWDSLSDAEDLMRSKQIRRIPVTDENQRIVGIVSLADVAKASQRTGAPVGQGELSPTAISSTFANIVQPHSQSRRAAVA